MAVSRTVFGWTTSAVREVHWQTALIDGLLDASPRPNGPAIFGDCARSNRRFVLVDETVMGEYGLQILSLLERFGIEHPPPLIVPAGEESKSQGVVDMIHEAMDGWGVSRFHEPLIVFGGGVLHDVGGYAAGTYRRGIDYIVINTTLVGLVDAMWALKVAISEGWKNRRGLYHPARYSWGDLSLCATLSLGAIRDGFAEIVKWAFAADGELVTLLEQHGPRVVAQKLQGEDSFARQIVELTIIGMLGELTANPWELNPARRSYFGHSMSPGLEPMLTHGQAVTLDCLISIHIAMGRGLITPLQGGRMVRVVDRLGLPLWHPVLEDESLLFAALRDTTLHRGHRQLVPLPAREVGNVVFVSDIGEQEILRAVEAMAACSVSTH